MKERYKIFSILSDTTKIRKWLKHNIEKPGKFDGFGFKVDMKT